MEKIGFVTDDGDEVEFYVEEETRVNGISYLLVTDSDGEEANAYGADFFFSIHSNATGTSSRVNQPLMLYRGFTNDPVSPEAKEMSLILNKQLLENQVTSW